MLGRIPSQPFKLGPRGGISKIGIWPGAGRDIFRGPEQMEAVREAGARLGIMDFPGNLQGIVITSTSTAS